MRRVRRLGRSIVGLPIVLAGRTILVLRRFERGGRGRAESRVLRVAAGPAGTMTVRVICVPEESVNRLAYLSLTLRGPHPSLRCIPDTVVVLNIDSIWVEHWTDPDKAVVGVRPIAFSTRGSR